MKRKVFGILFVLIGLFAASVFSAPQTQVKAASSDYCCPEGYFNNSAWCPPGTNTDTHCCRVEQVVEIFIPYKAEKVECVTHPNELCCPSGFTDQTDRCDGLDSRTECCKEFGNGTYKKISKVKCGTEVEGKFCCPDGYSDGSACNIIGNRVSQCCKDVKGAIPETVDKISCTLIADDSTASPFKLCQQIADGEKSGLCYKCYSNKGIWTAVGCIPTEPQSMVAVLIKIGLGLAGGVALIMILVAGFQLSTSMGDPKKTNEARDSLTAAIIGLIFIIFSVTILQFLGSQVLQIPGFGGT